MTYPTVASITFRQGPEYEAALALLEGLTDEQLETPAVAIELLKQRGLSAPLKDLIGMDQDAWEDFVMNNLGYE